MSEDQPASLAGLRRLIFSPDVPLARQRVRFAAAVTGRVAPGVARATLRLGGVPVERWTPPGAAPDRVIVYVHGGGYCLGSPAMGRELGSSLAVAWSASVVAPLYRLAPEHPCPAAVEDVAAVLGALAGPVVLGLADSAGAGALLAATAERPGALGAQVLVSPWLDLARDVSASADLAARDALVSPAWLAACARHYAPEPRDPRASPLRGARRALVPTLVVGTDDDLLAPDAAALARWPGVELREWPGQWHDFALTPSRSTAAAEARDVIAAFGTRVLGWDGAVSR